MKAVTYRGRLFLEVGTGVSYLVTLDRKTNAVTGKHLLCLDKLRRPCVV